jgi:hypothetical protein
MGFRSRDNGTGLDWLRNGEQAGPTHYRVPACFRLAAIRSDSWLKYQPVRVPEGLENTLNHTR